ncbi:type II secretion system F family protein [Arthrobacter gandavensis]|uniref:type II secretion system F family protein n=1 Tax=Arthrobacter gandavensis TaxID=169960 RepID=UPI00188E29BF|nr:type II secretion system F family protein [Arthrobacter gandavensis]MBF4994113.1 type II secretion system F family protein [Arthrobacter gandavensis]
MTGLAVGLLLCLAAVVLWISPVRSSGVASEEGSTDATGEAGRAAALGAGKSSGAAATLAAAPGIRDPALMLDLSAAMFSAGRPLGTVLLVLAETSDPPLGVVLRRVVTALELGAGWEQAWELGTRVDGREAREAAPAAAILRDALAFAASSGAPSAEVLHAQASQIRRRRARDAERRAAALGIQLVLPLGLCSLPAFLCVTVVPLLLALLPEF